MKGPSRATRTNPVYATPPSGDRRVNVRGVACPTCLAPIGEKCSTSRNNHPSRRRMAVRLLNQTSPEAPDTKWLESLHPSQRSRARRKAGLTQRQLAELVGCTLSSLRRWEGAVMRPTGPEGIAYVNWLKEHHVEIQPNLAEMYIAERWQSG